MRTDAGGGRERRPTSTRLEVSTPRWPDAKVIASYLKENEGVYLWLQLPGLAEPRYDKLPWDEPVRPAAELDSDAGTRKIIVGSSGLPASGRQRHRDGTGAEFGCRVDWSGRAVSRTARRDWVVTRRPTSPRDLANAEEPIVFVVDDDASMRDALRSLLGSVGLRTEMFGSAVGFLQSKLPSVPSCLVLDIRLPGVSGLDFQDDLAKADIHIPIIFMTGHGDIPMSVKAMKAGAVDFLTKPFRDQDMLDAVTKALERDRKRREDEEAVSGLRDLFETLTPREREVIALVTAGLMNKQTAAELGVSEVTVKIHRGHVMRKMGARSLAELVRMAELLEIPRNKPQRP